MCVVATERRRGAFTSEAGHETHVALLRFGGRRAELESLQRYLYERALASRPAQENDARGDRRRQNMDVDEEEEEAQTSATKLIFVKGNLHCAEYND